ncbi:DUF6882 domain-containing protein [Piscinibacter defluvii]|uniref:DUF6882 domain-containing protein n=1 Tax=Piscinibacter defluvii TaxID=1796922 RepID=UPI000FDD8A45|nr:DUF6882 domain-containing protein [Piscinibacter defluvii]
MDREFDSLLQRAFEAYRQKQVDFEAAISRFTQWNLVEEKCSLEFSGSHAQSRVFPVTPVATYLPKEQDWAWVWANDAFPRLSRSKSSVLKGLSLKTGYKIFETPYFRASTTDVDELCAVALHELNGTAVFKIKDQSPWGLYVVE